MDISVEISMYPLLESYREPIKGFIDGLSKNTSLTIEHGKMSTYLFGDYEKIMPLLQSEIETTLKDIPESIFVIKLSGGCH